MSDFSQDVEMKNESAKVQLKQFKETHEAKLIPKNLFTDMLQTAETGDEKIGNSQNTSNVSLMQLKLPSSVRMERKRFDPETYEIEPEIKFKNDVSLQKI